MIRRIAASLAAMTAEERDRLAAIGIAFVAGEVVVQLEIGDPLGALWTIASSAFVLLVFRALWRYHHDRG